METSKLSLACASTDHLEKLFIKTLTKGGSRSGWEHYTNWIDAISCTFRQAVQQHQCNSMSIEVEREYFKAIESDQKTSKFGKQYQECLSILIEALEKKSYDFLGRIAGEMGLLDGKWRGQFFTPQPVSEMMARITLNEAEPTFSKRLTLCEPAAGAGSTIIAAVTILKEKGFMPWHYWVQAQELDTRMSKACYIQLTLLGVPGIVFNMNTLSMEVFGRFTTIVGAQFPYIRDREKDGPSNAPEKEPVPEESPMPEPEEPKPTPAPPGKQAQMFFDF